MRAQDAQLEQFDMEFENVREANEDFDRDNLTGKDVSMDGVPDVQLEDDEMLNAVDVDDNLLEDINEMSHQSNISNFK